MIDFDAAAKAYLEFVLEHTKLAPSALAKQSRIASTTLTRFLNSEDYKFQLSTRTIEKIASATGIDPTPFFTDGKASKVRAQLMLANERSNAEAIPIELAVHAGRWIDRAMAGRMIDEVTWLLPSLQHRPDQFYCRMMDRSIDRLVQRFEYLHCLREDETFRPSEVDNKSLLVLERLSPDGQLVEYSARVLRKRSAHWVLSFDSDEPEFWGKELRLDEDDFKGPGLKVIGSVLSVVRHVENWSKNMR